MTITKNSRAAMMSSAPETLPPREANTGPAEGKSASIAGAPVRPDSRAASGPSTPILDVPREASTRPARDEATPICSPPVGTDSRTPGEASTPSLLAACEPYSPTAVPRPVPGILPPSGPDSRAATHDSAPMPPALREPISHATTQEPVPVTTASRGPNSRTAWERPMPSPAPPSGTNSHATIGQSVPVTTPSRGSNVPEANGVTISGNPSPRGSNSPDPAAADVSPPKGDSLLDPALALAADFLDDVERVKIANENRLRALTRAETDADGVDRYVGLDASHPVVAQLAAMVTSLAEVEHAAVLNLQRMLRKHPLHAWVKAQRGVGEKQAARLLAVIGDPYWRPEIVREDGSVLPEGPRTVSALWAYCGLHVLLAAGLAESGDQYGSAGGGSTSTGGGDGQDVDDARLDVAGTAARRRKGQQANWSTKAKTRAYLIAESCLKQLKAPCHAGDFEGQWLAVHYDECACSPYRRVYDRRKAHTSLTRPEWTDGHRHADALRVASKEVLKDLWRAAREHHLKGRVA